MLLQKNSLAHRPKSNSIETVEWYCLKDINIIRNNPEVSIQIGSYAKILKSKSGNDYGKIYRVKPSTDFMEYVLQQYNIFSGADFNTEVGDYVKETPKEAMRLAVSSANDYFKTDYTIEEVVNEIITIGETED